MVSGSMEREKKKFACSCNAGPGHVFHRDNKARDKRCRHDVRLVRSRDRECRVQCGTETIEVQSRPKSKSQEG